MPKFTLPHRTLLWVIGLALLLRLVGLIIFPTEPGDDTYWYITKGAEILTDTTPANDPINFGPGYALLAGLGKLLFGYDQSLWFLRAVQAVLGTFTCTFVWRIAYRATGDTRVAAVAGLGLALNPIFIVENSVLYSETLFLFLLCWGLSVYRPGSPRALVAAGGLLGLATLTRAMLLLFPVGLALHLALVCPWRRALRGALALLLVYMGVVGTWTLYNKVKFDRWTFGASGISDFLLMAVIGNHNYQAVDAAYAEANNGQVPSGPRRDQVALQAVGGAIRANPVGFVLGRSRQLFEALLQPHNTVYFPGESLKTLTVNWLREDRTLAGLGRLVTGDSFWPKLLLFVAHYLALIFGAVGLALARRQWRAFAPLTGLMAYTLLLHFFLLATPRYLFPMTPVLWVLAAVGMVWAWEKARKPVFSRPLMSQDASINSSAP
jgi:4-amino-4-deoxy-L-arabinose transferase-like glycosyltransferase